MALIHFWPLQINGDDSIGSWHLTEPRNPDASVDVFFSDNSCSLLPDCKGLKTLSSFALPSVGTIFLEVFYDTPISGDFGVLFGSNAFVGYADAPNWGAITTTWPRLRFYKNGKIANLSVLNSTHYQRWVRVAVSYNQTRANVYLDDVNLGPLIYNEEPEFTDSIVIGGGYSPPPGGEWIPSVRPFKLRNIRLYDTVLTGQEIADIPSPSVIKSLFEDSGNIKAYNADSNIFETIHAVPVLESDFEVYGVDLNHIPASSLNFDNVVKILTLAPEAPSVNLSAIPFPQVVISNTDIDLSNVNQIDSFTLTSLESGGGAIRVIASVDGGSIWRAWDGNSTWIPVDETIPSNVKAHGMTAAAFNAITSAQWTLLRGSSNTIRFAYYIEQVALTDDAEIDELSSQWDLNGTWQGAIHGTDYTYEWGNSFLKVTLVTSGPRKINYPVV